MNTNKRLLHSKHDRQRGVVTLFSAILILVLMTVALLYAHRNSLYDQRAASNEDRYRKAFAAAEGAIQVLQEYLVAESSTVVASTGWLDTSDPKWTPCPSSGAPEICTIDLDPAEQAWYIPNVGATDSVIQTAINAAGSSDPSLVARVAAVLQFYEDGSAVSTGSGGTRQAVFMIYGYGYADCATPNDLSTCQAEARVAQPLATYTYLSEPPKVPFTSASFVDANGTWTVVANPDAGGVGVPVSMWLNGNVSDSNDSGIDFDSGAGTWQTCEFDEWYEAEFTPDFGACPGTVDTNGILSAGNLTCGCSSAEILSGSEKGSLAANLDLLIDTNFPSDLFQVFFGVPKTSYQIMKDLAQVIPDCSQLDETSTGLYWITGLCSISSQVGHFDTPVILIGAGGFDINGGQIYGMVYCSDAESATPETSPTMRLRGNGVIYGSVVVDCVIAGSNGVQHFVYNEDILEKANSIAGIGPANGGWRDFDVPTFTGN